MLGDLGHSKTNPNLLLTHSKRKRTWRNLRSPSRQALNSNKLQLQLPWSSSSSLLIKLLPTYPETYKRIRDYMKGIRIKEKQRIYLSLILLGSWERERACVYKESDEKRRERWLCVLCLSYVMCVCYFPFSIQRDRREDRQGIKKKIGKGK